MKNSLWFAIMKISNKTRLNTVIGYPLAHSQSSVLHNAVYSLLGIDAVLLAQPHLQLHALIQAIKTLSIELAAVTSPYKEKVIQYVDECSPEVNVLQAANTLIQRNGKLYGYNTDIAGIAFALRDITVRDKSVLVIGAGGAARAMGYFLKKNKAKLYWMNRTKKKAVALAKEFGGKVICHNELKAIAIDIIINTTPIGMYPNVDVSPLPNYTFGAHQIVFDMIYNPQMSQLLKEAKKHKAKIVTGLDMFIGQGLKQIELLTGKRIHISSMLDKLRKILIQDQRAMFSRK
jgi:shikimate dehydrogenase